MLCAVLSRSRAMWLVGVLVLEVAEVRLLLQQPLRVATWPSRNTLMPSRRFAISRSCRWQISAMPASEKLRPLRIFLSSMSWSTRSMMSPICSMLIVNETMSVQRRLSFADSASREIWVR